MNQWERVRYIPVELISTLGVSNTFSGLFLEALRFRGCKLEASSGTHRVERDMTSDS